MAQQEQDDRDDAVTLILAPIGFTGEQEAAIRAVLGRSRPGPVRWRFGSLAEADAWLANGARTRTLEDGSLRIDAGEPDGAPVRLSLADVSKPIAFSEPLASGELEPAYTFRLDDPASMEALLALLENQWLAPAAVRLWLAARLVGAERQLSQRIYHVLGAGRLLAVVDRTGEIGLMPGLTVRDLQDASWLGRPSSARTIPESFQRTTISELVWGYALRSEADHLPERYHHCLIYFRRPPKIPQRLIGDAHLLVMRELVAGPASFAELEQRTGQSSAQLARVLAALYLAGSITSTPGRAPTSAHVTAGSSSLQPLTESLWSPSGQGRGLASGHPAARPDFTVPANLPGPAQGEDNGES